MSTPANAKAGRSYTCCEEPVERAGTLTLPSAEGAFAFIELLPARAARLESDLGAGVMTDTLDDRRRMLFTTTLGTTVALLTGGAIVRRRTPVIAVPCAAAIGLAASVLFVTAPLSFSAAQQNEWRDPSPHVVKFVLVATNVQLEVLDWGGTGPPLVLLAGLGDTAHVYDDVAPLLTARYRVVGVTRRAHGRSSAPLTGYGFARLAEDAGRVQALQPRTYQDACAGHLRRAEIAR